MAMRALSPSIAGSGPATIADAATGVYEWSDPQDIVSIQVDPGANSALRLRLTWNAKTTDQAGDWDAVLTPGDFITSPPDVIVKRLAIKAEGGVGATYPDDFSCRGWPTSGTHPVD